MQNIPIITIDGPSGSGKGTISQLLAKKLQFHFLDSGALYRVLAYAARELAVAFDDVVALEEVAKQLPVEFKVDEVSDAPQIMLNNKNISALIRTEQCGIDASKISSHQNVRKALLQRQRDFLQPPGLVADGRDMGTVVFPEANVKIFLTASMEERARRRYQQLKNQGLNISYEQIMSELTERDRRDLEREVSPTKPAEDAAIIDTSILTIEAVLKEVVDEVAKAIKN